MSTQQEPCLSACSREAVCAGAGLFDAALSLLARRRPCVRVRSSAVTPTSRCFGRAKQSPALMVRSKSKAMTVSGCGAGPTDRLRPVDKADAQTEKHRSALQKRNAVVQ